MHLRALTGIRSGEYRDRRRQLMDRVGHGGIVVLPAAREKVRSHDTHYPFRQDSNFLYLTGFNEPDAVLVLVPGRPHGEVILFCRQRNPEREMWDGPRAGTEGAVSVYGADDAYPIEDIDDILPGLMEGRSRVHYHFGLHPEFDLRMIGWVNAVRAQVRHGARPPHEFVELGRLLHEMRLFKSDAEIALMRTAADISVQAHRAAMAIVRPGMPEYVLQAEIEKVFRSHDGWPAYGSIVGAGSNGCVLHYVANNAVAGDGDLVLIDAGAEFRGYAADITRTFPVNGRFSPEQRVLYELVERAQSAAIAISRPGTPWEALHAAALDVLVDGLLSLGLLEGTHAEVLASRSYLRFYPHKSGHWLGLDVHDVGDYQIEGRSRLLEPGMVFTIEPGLYIRPDDTSVEARWRGIGIRTEDNLLITDDGHDNLTGALERSAEAVEAFIAEARSQG